LHLHNVIVTPSLVKNLVSVRQLTRDNNVSRFLHQGSSNQHGDAPM
jgi:hypothetical protein